MHDQRPQASLAKRLPARERWIGAVLADGLDGDLA